MVVILKLKRPARAPSCQAKTLSTLHSDGTAASHKNNSYICRSKPFEWNRDGQMFVADFYGAKKRFGQLRKNRNYRPHALGNARRWLTTLLPYTSRTTVTK